MRAALIICLIACPVQCPLTGSRAHEIEAICVNWIYLSFHSKALYFAVRTTARANECRADQILCVDLSYSDAMKCQGMKHHLKYHPVSYKRWPLIELSAFSSFFCCLPRSLGKSTSSSFGQDRLGICWKKSSKWFQARLCTSIRLEMTILWILLILFPMQRLKWRYWKFR